MKILTPQQREQLDVEGYVVVDDVLDPALDLEPVLNEYADVLGGIAESLQREGVIRSAHADLPLVQRLIAVCVESGRNFPQNFDFSLPLKGIKRETPIHLGPAIFQMLTNPRLLDLVEDVIGPEIFSNPVQHVRFKLPKQAVQKGQSSGLVSKIPWHQDNGVILPEADQATILTVWVPLTAATVRNSCMQVVPKSHRRGLVAHCPNGVDVGIPDKLIPLAEAVTLPMNPGSALLMTQTTMHTAVENVTTDDVRISMDLRYQPIGQASGRPMFEPAGFIARSRARPETVLRDPAVWAANWLKLRDTLADNNPVFNRWSAEAAMCA